MIWRIEVALKKQFNDPEALGLVHDAADLGITLEAVRFVRVYTVESDMTPKQAERVAGELIADPVTDRVSVNKPLVFKDLPDGHIIEVFRKPGVMDPVESSTLLGIRDMGLDAQGVATARKYIVSGKLEQKDLETVAGRILANAAIEDVAFSQVDPKPRVPAEPYELKVTTVDLLGASDSRLKQISRDMTLSLSLEEMQVIRDHFKSLDRNPTDVELETLAQTWSEHCVHKTFRGHVEMDDGTVIHNLLKQTVFKVTRELDRTWCVSVFHDNAGVIRFNKDYDLAFKAETHNHPSAIEPYGGAGTGIGGVIRDILGVGLGARPIFNTDVFCFGSPDMPQSDVPTGAMHPKRVMKGVVSGVRDYGNRMGIPTINGAVCFDDRFTGNPLVYCGTAGLIPRGKSKKAARKGDLVVVAGGRTGRDGIHGATFSSDELHEESETVSSGAVQIGNPITEKKVTDMLLVARDRELYTAVTDCGAGGLSSAVGEMGETLGAEVHLERVPLKYEGLSYTEIWISEAQERMVFSVPPQHERELHELFASENVESVTIGHFTGDGRLKLFYEDEQVCDIDMTFLHDGVPMITRKAVFKPKKHRNPAVAKRTDLTDELKAVLSRGNVASKEWIIRQYDHEVQGSSILKPLVGARADGPGDASVVAPVLGSSKGVVVGCGINPKYSDIDPYWMAASVIDEALRNVVAVGGSVDRTALLDNFCWGNTNKPDRMGGFVRAAQACYDVAKVYRTPFISGKDSLNNEFKTASGTVAIPGTLLVSAITLIDDVSRAVTMDLKTPGNLLVAVGATKDELGASEYYAARGAIGNNVPKLNPKGALTVLQAVESAIRKRLVRSCHDLGDGGLAVGLAEMAFAGDLGAEVALTDVPRTDEVTRDEQVLFSESNSRFVLEVTPKKLDRLMAQLSNVPAAVIGKVTDTPDLTVTGLAGQAAIRADLGDLKAAWQSKGL